MDFKPKKMATKFLFANIGEDATVQMQAQSSSRPPTALFPTQGTTCSGCQEEGVAVFVDCSCDNVTSSMRCHGFTSTCDNMTSFDALHATSGVAQDMLSH